MTDSSPDELTATSTTHFSFSSASSSAPALKALPRPISIRHSQSCDPSPPSPSSRPRKSLTNSRSSNSLSLLSSPTSPTQSPAHPHLYNSNAPNTTSDASHEYELRSQVSPLRSSPFSNPFRKLQNTFGGGKKSLDLGNGNGPLSSSNNNNNYFNNSSSSQSKPEKVVSSSSSASSLNSWRSKGAEILSKSWGRSRKNSEPLLSNTPGPMSSQPIFGANLEEAIRISHIPDTPMVPAVLHRCAQFLEAKGVDEVGLYRIPGSHANVQKLKRMFDTGKDYNLLTMDAIDANDIATLLKLYLRELPSPLLPPILLEQFQSLLTTDRHICHTLRGILIRLPRPNYVVLSYLCHHLSKIAAHSDKTKMTVSNLGVVFAPTLSIGSVLFKALLGGFYDGADTPENREKGLKIVWGGLLQDIGYGWSDEDEDGNNQDESGLSNGEKAEYQDPSGLSQQQSQHWIRHQQSLPTISLFSGQYTNGQSYHSVTHHGIGPLDPSPPLSPEAFRHASNDSDEESRLMQEMLLKEELATIESVEISRPPGQNNSAPTFAVDNTQPPSHTTSTAEAVPNHLTTASSTTSNTVQDTAGQNSSSSTVAIPITSFEKPLSLHMTASTGNMSNTPPTSAGKATSPESPLNDASAFRSATGAPHLPLLEFAIMSDQPPKNDNSKNQLFLRRPPAQTHRLKFSITSTSRNIHVSGNSATNNSNNNNNKASNTTWDENNRNSGRRAGSAFSFQPATNTASSAGRTAISQPHSAAAPAQQASVIEGSASSSRPLPITSAKRLEPAPPEHLLTKVVEQGQTPPKSLPNMRLENTITAPKISIPVVSAPSVPIMALQHQHSPLDGVELAFTGDIAEPAGHEPQELTSKESIPKQSVQLSDHVLGTITNIAHFTTPKQEEGSTLIPQANKLPSSAVSLPIASTADMTINYGREDLLSSVLTHAPQDKAADLTDISAMLMDRAMIKQQWIQAEQQRFKLMEELRMRVKEESDKFHSAWQKVQVMNMSNAALQTENSRLQADVAILKAQVAESQSRLQEIGADRKREADVYETSRNQMAVQLASVKQISMEASFTLESLATDKSRWEAELATLKAGMQAMEIDRGLLSTSHDHLTESLSMCSSHLKGIQAAYDKVQGICHSRQEEIDQYRDRCESLSGQMSQLSERVGELNQENNERHVANEALQVANHSMSDQINFLTYAIEYQQSTLTSQLRDVEDRCRETNAEELNKLKHDLTEAKELAAKDIAVLESNIREGTLSIQGLTSRNAQLDAEVNAMKGDTARYQEIITQLQGSKRRLESENQHLIQSSMGAQADYVIELNATVERFEELRQREAKENQALVEDKDAQIGELTKRLESKTRELEEISGEKQQLDHEMLELRVKIQLLQSDQDFVVKARDGLKKELEALQQAQAAQQQQQQMQQQSMVPMPLTDIARLHSRDHEGGGEGSTSVTDFLQWPMDLETPSSARPSSRTGTVVYGSPSPNSANAPAGNTRAPSSLMVARISPKATTTSPTAAAGTPSSRSRGVAILPSPSATTPAAAGLNTRVSSSNDSTAGKRAAAATATGRGGGNSSGSGGGEKRSLKRKRTENKAGSRGGADGGGGAGCGDRETSDQEEGEFEAKSSGSGSGPSTGTSTGGVGVGASTVKTRRTYSKRLAQQQQPPQTGSSTSSSSTATTAIPAAAAKKSTRGK
ncbi:hypothetical protein BG015_002502 [Linnemannia schmuckeri]|uniref:Rho-GAP domain-containing protein n=1 Tax=Linnemannia schmuckeri TaxID=64567 RepID=A0A9P5S771_9FUNG|nr:hypothetical protein BG015_002502 [Linnemannia schmuckeri]